MFLIRKLKQLLVTPNLPDKIFLYFEPIDSAASSIIGIPSFIKESKSAMFPYKFTATIALVFFDIKDLTDSVDKHQVLGSISAKTGFAPKYIIGATLAIHVTSGTITSSFFLFPEPLNLDGVPLYNSEHL